MKIVKIDIENNISNIELEYNNDIIKSFNDIDNTLKLLYEWNFENNIIQCYGCLDSDYKIKNQHILPKNGISTENTIYDKSNECNIYGNIYLICKNDNNYIDIIDSDYGMLYFNINDNLDNIYTDNEEEEEEEYIKENNNSYNIDNIDNTSNNMIDILDNDNNIY